MKIRKSRNYRRGRIEIIPMIDVMFFLLVTFMIASLSMQQINAVRINLPKGTASLVEDKAPVTLTISADGRVFLDKSPVTPDSMVPVIRQALAGRDQVVVYADDKAPHGLVVRCMLKAREAGARHFKIAIKPE